MGDADGSADAKPKNVSQRMWEKFRLLEKRVEDTTKRSTEKRIKHLQKTALENVARALTHPDDGRFVSLPQETEHTAHPSSSQSTGLGKRKRSAESPAEDGDEATKFRDDGAKETVGEEGQWSKVRDLLSVNEHLAGVSHGNLGPKTVLELKIEEAIAAGDFKKAEELSDHMATREFGEKITKAIDAKNFLEHKQREEEAVKAKKKKKLNWGFEAKQRWETKSNM